MLNLKYNGEVWVLVRARTPEEAEAIARAIPGYTLPENPRIIHCGREPGWTIGTYQFLGGEAQNVDCPEGIRMWNPSTTEKILPPDRINALTVMEAILLFAFLVGMLWILIASFTHHP